MPKKHWMDVVDELQSKLAEVEAVVATLRKSADEAGALAQSYRATEGETARLEAEFHTGRQAGLLTALNRLTEPESPIAVHKIGTKG